LVEGNTMSGCSESGVTIEGKGASPCVRGNDVSGGKYGVCGRDSCAGTVAANHVHGTAVAACRSESSCRFTCTENKLVSNLGCGVLVEGAGCGTIESNDVCDNAGCGVRICGAGCDPLLEGNRIYRNGGGGLVVRGAGARGTVKGNDMWLNASFGVRIEGGGADASCGAAAAKLSATAGGGKAASRNEPIVTSFESNHVREHNLDGAGYGAVLAGAGVRPTLVGDRFTANAVGLHVSGAGSDPDVSGFTLANNLEGAVVTDHARGNYSAGAIVASVHCSVRISRCADPVGSDLSIRDGCALGVVCEDGGLGLFTSNTVDNHAGIAVLVASKGGITFRYVSLASLTDCVRVPSASKSVSRRALGPDAGVTQTDLCSASRLLPRFRRPHAVLTYSAPPSASTRLGGLSPQEEHSQRQPCRRHLHSRGRRGSVRAQRGPPHAGQRLLRGVGR
jgi:hypothetical protein